MNFKYDPDLKQLERLAIDVELFGKENKLHKDLVYNLNLCLDELVTNIISYGFKGQKPSPIYLKLDVDKNGGFVTATLEDHAEPFDPVALLRRDPDINSEVEDRPIGGLGVYFVNKYMDSINYQRNDGVNKVTLKTKTK